MTRKKARRKDNEQEAAPCHHPAGKLLMLELDHKIDSLDITVYAKFVTC